MQSQKDARKRFGWFAIVEVFAILATAVLLFIFTVDASSIKAVIKQTPSEFPPVILMWSPFFGHGRTNYLETCPVRCILTYNRSQFQSARAVVFHSRDIQIADLPRPQFDDQRFVLFAMESAFHYGNLRSVPKGFFHWSMTYLNSSDIVSPYGGPWISREQAKAEGIPPLNLPDDWDEIMREKEVKGALWMVSNCATPSGRELAVNALSKHFRVDVVGACAHNASSLRSSCPKSGNNECESRWFRRYYFYIAAENSICKDYITEKYWGRIRYPAVPIVMRRYIYESHLPPNSFIAMDDFLDAEALAVHLNYLVDNPHSYMEYFEWRRHEWTIALEAKYFATVGFCNLCKKLLSGDLGSNTTRIPDVDAWFANESRCERDQFSRQWSRSN